MKKVGFFGINPSSRNFHAGALPYCDGVPVSAGTDLPALLEGFDRTDNKGNMLHGEAPSKIFSIDRAHSAYVSVSGLLDAGWSIDRIAETLSKRFDAIVFSTANIIRAGIRHESTADLLDRLTCDFIVLGVGVQDGLAVDLGKLEPSLVQLLDVCNRKARIFGVRGEVTQRWLHAAGLRNSTVLGCPSLFVYPENILSITPPVLSPDSRVLTGGHLAARTRRSSALVGLFRGVEQPHYVMQEEMEDLRRRGVFAQTTRIFNEATGEVDFGVMSRVFSEIHDERMPFKSYRWFQAPEAWRAFASGFDVYIGDRLHGAVAALQSGVPTVLVADDDRVREIADLFSIPSVGIADIEGSQFRDVVASRLDRDAIEAFKARYRIAFDRFSSALMAAGMPLVSALELAPRPAAAETVRLQPKRIPKRGLSVARSLLRRL